MLRAVGRHRLAERVGVGERRRRPASLAQVVVLHVDDAVRNRPEHNGLTSIYIIENSILANVGLCTICTCLL